MVRGRIDNARLNAERAQILFLFAQMVSFVQPVGCDRRIDNGIYIRRGHRKQYGSGNGIIRAVAGVVWIYTVVGNIRLGCAEG